MRHQAELPLILLISLSIIFIWSVIHPKDYFTWALEVSWVAVGIPILVCMYPRIRLTHLLYLLIWVHSIILIVGGHYTYSEMPVFNWLKDVFGLSRNHYDRLGHFAQGFIPAILTREILIRNAVVRSRKWLFFIVVSICLAFSAFFEFIEWWVALISGSRADAFLATQGDVWDTQWDMFLAMTGAVISLLTLSGLHDRSLHRLHGSSVQQATPGTGSR